MEQSPQSFPLPTDHEAETGQEPSPSAINFHPVKPKKNWGKPLAIAAAAVLLLAAAGGGAYWYLMMRPKPQPKPQTSTSSQQSQPIPTTTTSSTTAQYISNGKDLNLTFTYPSDWTAKPASGNNQNDQAITLSSPLVSFSDASGTTITGRAIVSIRPGSAQMSELASGKAVAAQASQQFAYTKPTTAQHQYPYLTFIHLAGGSNPSNGFEEVMVTGVTQFNKDQGVTAFSLGQLDPIISATFYKCTAQACSSADSNPVSITNSTWQNTDIFKQVQALFESLQLN